MKRKFLSADRTASNNNKTLDKKQLNQTYFAVTLTDTVEEKKNVTSEKASGRLIDIAKEFTVTIKDLSNFLKSKGYKIEPRPNIKINSEQYNLLRKKFLISTNKTRTTKKLTFKRMIKNFVVIREKEGKAPPKLEMKKVYLKKVRGGRPESNRRKF